MIYKEFHTNFDVRIGVAKKHIENLKRYELNTNLPESLIKDCVYSYDNIKNDIDIFAELKGAVFALKEALDVIFANIKRNNRVKLDKDYKKLKENVKKINNINCKEFLLNLNNLRKIIFLRDLRNYLKISSNLVFIIENFKQIKTKIKLNGDAISALENRKIQSYNLIVQIPKFLENYVFFLNDLKKVCCE